MERRYRPAGYIAQQHNPAKRKGRRLACSSASASGERHAFCNLITHAEAGYQRRRRAGRAGAAGRPRARARLVAAEVFLDALLQDREELAILQVLLVRHHALARLQAADAQLVQHAPARRGSAHGSGCRRHGWRQRSRAAGCLPRAAPAGRPGCALVGRRSSWRSLVGGTSVRAPFCVPSAVPQVRAARVQKGVRVNSRRPPLPFTATALARRRHRIPPKEPQASLRTARHSAWVPVCPSRADAPILHQRRALAQLSSAEPH